MTAASLDALITVALRFRDKYASDPFDFSPSATVILMILKDHRPSRRPRRSQAASVFTILTSGLVPTKGKPSRDGRRNASAFSAIVAASQVHRTGDPDQMGETHCVTYVEEEAAAR